MIRNAASKRFLLQVFGPARMWETGLGPSPECMTITGKNEPRMGRERACFRREDLCWRTSDVGVDRQPDHATSIEGRLSMVAVASECLRVSVDAKLVDV